MKNAWKIGVKSQEIRPSGSVGDAGVERDRGRGDGEGGGGGTARARRAGRAGDAGHAMRSDDRDEEERPDPGSAGARELSLVRRQSSEPGRSRRDDPDGTDRSGGMPIQLPLSSP